MMLRKAVTGVAAGLAAAAVVMTLGLAGCGEDNGANSGDGEGGGGGGGGGGGNYKSVKIGTQTWMSENLNIDVQGSVCYDNDPANCAKYGRLYNWEAAKTACPAGWHLPSNDEWETLTDFVGGSSVAGKKLKSKTGWEYYSDNTVGTDEFGFSALPGGHGDTDGGFGGAGRGGFWWSAMALSANNALYNNMNYVSELALTGGGDKAELCSVRCVQD